MIVALVIGAALALLALLYVLAPLFLAAAETDHDGVIAASDHAVAALREIEFDRATGKLSEVDYGALRARYTAAALAELSADRDGAANGQASRASDPLEVAVASYRSGHRECAVCGVRPEPGAVYCSECGRYLDARCGRCGSALGDLPGARFCPTCGQVLTSTIH